MLSTEEREKAVVGDGIARFLQLLSFKTKSGWRQCVRRRDGTTRAAQILPLWLPPEYASSVKRTGLLERQDFVAQLIEQNLVELLLVQLIGVERLITRFAEFNWSSNALVEIAGGVCNDGETDVDGGLRELREELQLSEQQILCCTQLTGSMPFDGGIHIESTALIAVVFTGNYEILPAGRNCSRTLPALSAVEVPSISRAVLGRENSR